MSWLRKLFEKKVDERQEMDLLQIEHYGFWLMFWMLLAEIIIQGVVLDGGDKIFGEGIVFMGTCVFVVIGWIRKGVWSYQAKKVPGVKSYLLYSLITALISGALGALMGVKENPGNLSAIMFRGVMVAVNALWVTFFVLLVVGGIAKGREKKLEMEAIAEDEEGEEK